LKKLEIFFETGLSLIKENKSESFVFAKSEKEPNEFAL
jgi:hypothetical protein